MLLNSMNNNKMHPETEQMKKKTEGSILFEKLVLEVEKPEKQDWTENVWVCPSTWSLVDQRAAMRKEGTQDRHDAQLLVRRMKAFIKDNRKHQERQAGEADMAAVKLLTV